MKETYPIIYKYKIFNICDLPDRWNSKYEKLQTKSILNINHPQRNQNCYEFYNWLIENFPPPPAFFSESISQRTGPSELVILGELVGLEILRDHDYSKATVVFE